jgi:uncharacterized protein YndB with AHSA1/START domain
VIDPPPQPAGLIVEAGTFAELQQAPVPLDRIEIVVETVVNAPPTEVYALWTSPTGVTKFFAPKAEIDARAGGDYTIIFAPDHDPDGRSYGTKGARILRLDPPHALSFEWIPFTADAQIPGVSGPPAIPAAERNAAPLPTWVEITFDPVGDGSRTRIRLAHYGFRHGGKWDESYAFFQRAWTGVLNHLAALYE